MYAVVEIAGRQYKVSKNDKITVPTLKTKPGESLTIEKVLLIGDDKKVSVGNPLVAGARVQATVLEHFKGQKAIVFKKKKRKGYRVKRGHRQNHTSIEITDIAQ